MRYIPIKFIISILLTTRVVADEYVAKSIEIQDLKAVSAVIDSVRRTFARSRINGTIDALSVTESDWVKKGQLVAIVVVQSSH